MHAPQGSCAQTMLKRLWGRVTAFLRADPDYPKCTRKRYLRTSSPGKNIRRREFMILTFSIHGISGGKADTDSNLGQDGYLRSCHFLLFFLQLWVTFSSVLQRISLQAQGREASRPVSNVFLKYIKMKLLFQNDYSF